jgi:hypothetical protein
MKADLVNLAQALSVGSLAVGESGLQILRYAAGEFRLTGAVRADGIFRGLGGLIPGAFTTTARDAIANGAGLKPYGMAILNPTTNRWEWNAGTDSAAIWLPFGLLAAQAPSYELDRGERVSDLPITAQSEAASQLVVTGNSITYDGTKVLLEFKWAGLRRTTASGGSGDENAVVTAVFECDSTVIEYVDLLANLGGGGGGTLRIEHTPSAGAHTYSVRMFNPATSMNVTIQANTGGSNRGKAVLRVLRAT